MEQFTDAVRKSIGEHNWFAALGLALAMPDICGGLESPEVGSRTRYVAWCETYLTPKYTRAIGADGSTHVFLHGSDCYALRCAVLHEGSDHIVRQSARRALDSFVFVAPMIGGSVHCNQFDARLQLQVDRFATDICLGVDEWARGIVGRSDIETRVAALMTIQTLDNGFEP